MWRKLALVCGFQSLCPSVSSVTYTDNYVCDYGACYQQSDLQDGVEFYNNDGLSSMDTVDDQAILDFNYYLSRIFVQRGPVNIRLFQFEFTDSTGNNPNAVLGHDIASGFNSKEDYEVNLTESDPITSFQVC